MHLLLFELFACRSSILVGKKKAEIIEFQKFIATYHDIGKTLMLH